MMHWLGGGSVWIPAVFGVHAFFMGVFVLGVVFLLIWAIRLMDKNQLRMWTKWLLIVGIIGCVLTVGGVLVGMQKVFKDGDFAFDKFSGGGKWGCPALQDSSVDASVKDATVKPEVKTVK